MLRCFEEERGRERGYAEVWWLLYWSFLVDMLRCFEEERLGSRLC